MAKQAACSSPLPLLGTNQQLLLPNTSPADAFIDRSVTIQRLPLLSSARLSGLAKPRPPAHGVPPVTAMRQVKRLSLESLRRITQPLAQLL